MPSDQDTNHEQNAASERFVTDHLPLASYLAACGDEPALKVTGSGTVLFTFASSDRLQDEVSAFQNRAARIEPTSYDLARVRLRKRMDAEQRGAR